MSSRGPVVYIVDDDASIRDALSLLLKEAGFRVESFKNASEFLEFKHLKRPSCLILDIKLPDINGLELQKIMEDKDIFIPIIFITGHGDIPMSVKGIKAGAVDFLPKPITEKKLVNAVTQAISKHKTLRKKQSKIESIHRRIDTLTPREKEVFQLVAREMHSKQIASRLGTVLQTIKVHRARVMKKMKAKNVTELIQLARKAGIIPPLK